MATENPSLGDENDSSHGFAGEKDHDSGQVDEPQTPERDSEPGENPPLAPGRENSRMGEMGFFDHLEELRWRIIKSVIGLVVGALICAVFVRTLIEDVLLGPATRLGIQLQNFEVMGQVTLAIQVCLICGFILAIPVIIWQFWQFVKPGLYSHEKKYISVIAVATIFSFLVGISFAYFVMIPASIGFAAQFEFGTIDNDFAVSSYFSFTLGFILACGLIFEMPMLSYALSRFGIVTAAMLKKFRRHAVVILLIVAAIITPTPDPINQLLLATPLYLLYEISIIVARLAGRQREEALEEFGQPSDQAAAGS